MKILLKKWLFEEEVEKITSAWLGLEAVLKRVDALEDKLYRTWDMLDCYYDDNDRDKEKKRGLKSKNMEHLARLMARLDGLEKGINLKNEKS